MNKVTVWNYVCKCKQTQLDSSAWLQRPACLTMFADAMPCVVRMRTPNGRAEDSSLVWKSEEWCRGRLCFYLSNVTMAATLIPPTPPDLNSSSSADSSSSSNRSISRSLRVAEKAIRESKAEDPIVAALKYFSKGRLVLTTTELHPPHLQYSSYFHLYTCVAILYRC